MIQHSSIVWIQVSLITSNTFKSKQTFSYSLKNIKSLFQVYLCIVDYKTHTAFPVAHALHQKCKTDFG